MKERLLGYVLRIPARQLALAAAGVLLLAAALLVSSLRPLYSEWRAAHAKRINFQNSITDRHLLQSSVDQLSAEVARLSASAAMRNSEMPDQLIIGVMQELNRISVGHQAELGSVTPALANPFLMFYEIPFAVEIKGRYQHLMTLLREVEATLPHVSVSAIDAQRAGAGGQLLMKVNFSIYQGREKK